MIGQKIILKLKTKRQHMINNGKKKNKILIKYDSNGVPTQKKETEYDENGNDKKTIWIAYDK
jgi:hypothetical protein